MVCVLADHYIEGQRIVSKLGGGMGEQGTSKAGHGSVGYVRKHQALIDGIVRNLKFRGESLSRRIAGTAASLPRARAARCLPGQACPDEGGIWRRHGRRRL